MSGLLFNNNVPSINSTCIGSKLSSVWHLRLGHPSLNSLRLILKTCNIPFHSKDNNIFCTACCMGKTHMLPFASHITHSTPLELIYCDLGGPSPNSSTLGFSYYMSFVDAYSKFTWFYLLKYKSKALIIFKQFKSMVELQHCYPIKLYSLIGEGSLDPSPNSYLS